MRGALHTIGCAAGYNLRWPLRAIARPGIESASLYLLQMVMLQAMVQQSAQTGAWHARLPCELCPKHGVGAIGPTNAVRNGCHRCQWTHFCRADDTLAHELLPIVPSGQRDLIRIYKI